VAGLATDSLLGSFVVGSTLSVSGLAALNGVGGLLVGTSYSFAGLASDALLSNFIVGSSYTFTGVASSGLSSGVVGGVSYSISGQATGSFLKVLSLDGYTKNVAREALGNCVVKLYQTADDVVVAQTTSHPTSGFYEFTDPVTGPFYAVAYLPGSPDVAGTTVNTLMPT
jgi:ABC-type multidrug transport system permease subunit